MTSGTRQSFGATVSVLASPSTGTSALSGLGAWVEGSLRGRMKVCPAHLDALALFTDNSTHRKGRPTLTNQTQASLTHRVQQSVGELN